MTRWTAEDLAQLRAHSTAIAETIGNAKARDKIVVAPKSRYEKLPPLSSSDAYQGDMMTTEEVLALADKLDKARYSFYGTSIGKACDTLRFFVAERDEMKKWVDDLQSGMYINCVYCGHRYGPENSTPASMADILKAHIEQCPKHPMSALVAERDALITNSRRYLWLKSNHLQTGSDSWIRTGDDLEEAIDAALAQEEK